MIEADTKPLNATARARFCRVGQSRGVPVIALRVRIVRKDAHGDKDACTSEGAHALDARKAETAHQAADSIVEHEVHRKVSACRHQSGQNSENNRQHDGHIGINQGSNEHGQQRGAAGRANRCGRAGRAGQRLS